MSDTDWGTTNRVWYCEVHDSLIRSEFISTMNPPQCDWAIAGHIPTIYELCTVEMFNLTRLVGA